MDTNPNRPKLVFFQNKYDERLPEFLLTHKQEHVNCLSLFFDVTVIQDDCDYEQICDIYKPDLALFESGVNLLTCRKPRIRNVLACKTIPKLGFLNADAWCETRSGSLSDMDQWGIETVFSISATVADHMPAIANRLFVWPNFVDPAVYRDYKETKLIPVLLSGATAAQYPWRRRVYKLIAEHYPSLWCPHRGYLSRSSTGQVLSGERYARTINASDIAPLCGTVAKEVVRKHFEIPACNTCLITERTRNLEQAGFVDMTNCVFADEHDILDKLEFLFSQPDRLRQITTAGHQLVHARHTQQNRNQILQWFNLNKNLNSDQKIVQANPFAPLTVVSETYRCSSSTPVEVGTHLQLLREGDDMLWAAQVAAADSKYRRCLSYMHKLPEARFKLALCMLYKGEAADANSRIFELIQYCVAEYGAADPDPVEWAYYIISLLCMGRISDARKCSLEFPRLQHPELNRVRRAVQVLSRNESRDSTSFDIATVVRQSIHILPERTETVWGEELYRMLLACGQVSKAEMIAEHNYRLQSVVFRELRGRKNQTRDLQGRTMATLISHIFSPGILNRKLAAYRIRRKLLRINVKFTSMCQQVGRRFSVASPAHATDMHLITTIRELARDLDVKKVLIIGGSSAATTAMAVVEGTLGSDGSPLICCVSDSKYLPLSSTVGSPTKGYIKWYPLALDAAKEIVNADFESTIHRLKCDNQLEHFDLVVMAWREMGHRVTVCTSLCEELRAARLVVFEDLRGEYHRDIYSHLLAESTHVLLDASTAAGDYVMFKQKKMTRAQDCRESAYSSSPICAD